MLGYYRVTLTLSTAGKKRLNKEETNYAIIVRKRSDGERLVTKLMERQAIVHYTIEMIKDNLDYGVLKNID